ncbi:hypothetical protein BASA50_005148 [Batrachochytrium salamandrivorans]|uniref:Tetratricopeptide repeat protein 21B n=1 Tax=Batrachochytrium salamandrivorans TaxID=1357716 RepID=A0ABQ8FDK5_9FUNG|nr:hypothetical protein BASA50_005148 [Batrachochytrium salamandrivorans]KAH9275572.1 hypothetical protein BASA83_001857 [Batrachochytrium salamandrivorans]
MSSIEEDHAVIHYYLRREQFQHVVVYCDTKLKKRLSEPILILWRAFALVNLEKSTDALRELAQLQDKRDMALAYPLAAIYAYENCKHTDHEALDEMQARLTIAASSPSITERAYIFAGLICAYTARPDAARQYFRSSLAVDGGSSIANVYLGWLDLTTLSVELASKKGSSWFDKALDKNSRDIEALLGRLTFLKRHLHQLPAAVDITTQLIVFYPSFLPAYIERIYLYLEMLMWDQALEVSQQITAMSPNNIDALCFISLHELCRDGGARMAPNYISNLFDVLGRVEPKNANLFYLTSQPFSRLANRHPQVLDQCQRLVERAISIKPTTSAFHVELGYILFLQGQISRAKDSYNAAAAMDPQNILALEGSIRCQIFSNDLDGAQEQLDMFNEFQSSMGRSAEIAYLNSVLVWKKHADVQQRLLFLNEAVEQQFQVIRSGSPSLDYYVKVNPDFLLEITKDYMELCAVDSGKGVSTLHHARKTVQDILEVICKIVPASTESLYCLSQINLLLGDVMSAETTLAKCLKLNESNSKAHLLMAEVHMVNERYKSAISSLEMALSYNFEIRHIPNFHLFKARALKYIGSYEDALSALKTAMNLPAVKDLIRGIKQTTSPASQLRPELDKIPTIPQLASLYLEMIDVYTRQKETSEANRTIQEASGLFLGTNEEHRITIASADSFLAKQDVDNALGILGTIRSDQPYFIEAKSRMADIYLKYKKSPKNYARCYSEIVEKSPSVESCILLGDAYMNIQEPEQAVLVYQSALTANPERSILACKIGKALIKTHDYERAISYYESVLESRSETAISLKYDLAELFIKLKRYHDAETLILSALEHSQGDEPSVMMMNSKFHSLLALVFKTDLKPDQAFSSYMNARDLHTRLLTQGSTVNQSETKQILADLSFELAEIAQFSMRDFDRAVSFYNEAVQYLPAHKKASISLAKLYIKKADTMATQSQLALMIKSDIASDEATLMMANTMYLNGSYQQAIFHFQQLLEKNPLHFEALSQYIELIRRNANMNDVSEILSAAEKQFKKAVMEPGFHYCRGLYFRYSSHLNEALKEFTICRRDAQWGERSLHHLIDMFLNPGNETIGGGALGNRSDELDSTDVHSDGGVLGIRTAGKLIKELPQQDKSLRTQVLECHLLIASKEKAQIETALSLLMNILNVERDYIPAIYCTSVGFMLLNQPPRARNQLKRVAKMEWTIEFGDDVEKCWLLLADIYIQGGKYDMATDLLKKIIMHNKSSCRAYEYMGFIMEKEAAYKDAADNYYHAWQLDNQSSAAIGFKLAFNYLKAKRYVDAIDVCHIVLKQSPDYPKIEKDIMEKARASLRFP